MASSLFGSPTRAPRGMAASNAAGRINPQAIQSVKRMMNTFRAAKNPGAAMQMMAQQNPQIAAVLQMCSGRNPKDVFYEQCRQHGLNPDEIAGQLM